MIPQWCALCLVGHSSAASGLALVESDGKQRWIDPLADAHLVREAAGVKRLRSVNGQLLNLALTVYGGTPVCAWHLDEEIGRRRLCR